MPTATSFKKLIAELSDALPSNFDVLKKDFEKNCQGILTTFFDKFDLVTREEFDTQTKVLARTRKKLEDLEKQVKELEALLTPKRRK